MEEYSKGKVWVGEKVSETLAGYVIAYTQELLKTNKLMEEKCKSLEALLVSVNGSRGRGIRKS